MCHYVVPSASAAFSIRGLKQDRRGHAPMNVFQRALGVGIQGPAVRHLASNIGLDGGGQPGFSKLAEDRTAELRYVQRGRAELSRVRCNLLTDAR